MRYRVIAIEREYASGGSEIGQKLAERLGVPCYGQEILERAAAKMNVPVGEVRRQEETITGALRQSVQALSWRSAGQTTALTPAQQLCLAEIDVIQELAHEGPCVIVGRAAAGALREEPDILKVFVRADMASRLARAADVYGHGHDKAEAVLREFDKHRARYYKVLTGETWGGPASFHLVLDSGRLGIDTVVSALEAVASAA